MKKLITLLSLCISLHCGSLFAQSSSLNENPKVEKLIAQADTLLKKKDLLAFIAKIEEASQIHFSNQKWEEYFLLELRIAKNLILFGKYKQGHEKANQIARESIRYLGQNNEIEAKAHNYIGFCLFGTQKYREAIYHLKKSLAFFEVNNPTHSYVVDNLTSIGACFTTEAALQYDSALYYYFEALRRQQQLDTENSNTALLLSNIADVFHRQGMVDSTLFYARKSIKIHEAISEPDPYSLLRSYLTYGTLLTDLINDYDSASFFYQKALSLDIISLPDSAALYNNIGTNYWKTGKYHQALDFYETGLQVTEYILKSEGTSLSIHRNLLHNIGATFYALNQPQRALSYHQQATRLYEKHYESNPHPDLAGIYNNIASDYKSLEQYDSTLHYYRKSLAMNKRLLKVTKTNSREVVLNYINIGDTYLLTKNTDRAKHYFNLALELLNNDNNPDLYYRGSSYNYLGTVYQMKKEYPTALTYYSKALRDFNTIYSSESLANHPARLDCINNIGYTYFLQGQYGKALEQYQKALSTSDYEGIDDTEPHSEKTVSPHQSILFPILHNKTLALEKRYETEDNIADLVTAAQTIRQSDILLDSLRKYAVEDKTTLAKRGKPVYETAIRIHHALYQHTKDKEHINQAFYYSEKSKGLVLLLLMVDSEAKAFSNIPDQLLQREEELRITITHIQDSIERNPTNSFHKEHLFNIKREYYALINQLEKQYPSYYQAKYGVTIKDIQAIQSDLLAKETAMLSYFVGEQHLYAFTITKEDQNLLKIPKDFPLQEWVKDFNSGIYDYWSLEAKEQTSSAYDKYTRDYIGAARRLYDKLFAPIAGHLPRTIIIVPDEELNFVSFAALLTQKPTDERRFSDYPYLLKEYQISYAYSAILLAQMKNQQNIRKQGWLGLAPSFSGEQQDLIHTTEEVRRIQTIMGGDAIIGENATLDVFREKAANYPILHLATHAINQDDAPRRSSIFFANPLDDSQNTPLKVGDIYNMNLNSDMVVLSACETGSGPLLRGEGVMSLARAFTYAGAKNITATLWSVKDQPSYKIMVHYYELLAHNMPKDHALQQSQLDYLNKISDSPKGEVITHRMKHPYYWAGYITLGDTSGLAVNGLRKTYWFYIVSLILLITLVFYIKRKSS